MNDLDRTCEELRRLLALDRDVDPATVTRLFGDPDRAEELYRPRSTEELRELVEARRAGSSPPMSSDAVANAVAAFWRWARIGFGVVDPVLLARRLDACAACEHYVEPPADVLYAMAGRAAREAKICARCGCFVGKKARLASEACPDGRW